MSDVVIIEPEELNEATGTLDPDAVMLYQLPDGEVQKVKFSTLADNFPEGPQGDTGLVAHRSFTFVFDGGGSLIAPATNGTILDIPFAGTIREVIIRADQATTATIDFFKTASAGDTPDSGDSIIGTADPGMTAATKAIITDFTDWGSTTITKYDQLACALLTNSAATRLAITVVVEITGE